MKKSNWFWGLFFIFTGIFIIVGKLGFLGELNIWTILFTIFLVMVMIESFIHFNFSGILFPLALIGILYADELGIQSLTPWPILVAALFASIGLSFLIPPRIRHKKDKAVVFDEIIDKQDDRDVQVGVSFGSSIKYVNTKDFQRGYFTCSFGALKVYFDQAVIQKEAVLELHVSFGGVELYIPKGWEIVNEAHCILGGIDEKNSNSFNAGPKLVLKGNVSFAGVEIIYV